MHSFYVPIKSISKREGCTTVRAMIFFSLLMNGNHVLWEAYSTDVSFDIKVFCVWISPYLDYIDLRMSYCIAHTSCPELLSLHREMILLLEMSPHLLMTLMELHWAWKMSYLPHSCCQMASLEESWCRFSSPHPLRLREDSRMRAMNFLNVHFPSDYYAL